VHNIGFVDINLYGRTPLKNAILGFVTEVIIAGITSWGAGKVEQKLEEVFVGKKETTLLDDPEIIITCGIDVISDKIAEYINVKDNLIKAERRGKYKQAKHIAYHLKCVRRDLDMMLLDLMVAPGAIVTEEFLDQL
jgi:hypothetical protein